MGTAVYRAGVAAGLPNHVPTDVGDAARDTLGAAVAVAGQLPADLRPVLLEVTRDAFVQGLHVVSALSAAIAFAAAVIALVLFREVQPAG